ncbi:MAG: hypothetical protein CVU39_09340 [Chloroflexi bacterium HGW-Chloroflexi-10]|nr:MAG: hypothetical protein CVU39_09340 [Chloroflexi bacterium HGW-Chloroflexi-10]
MVVNPLSDSYGVSDTQSPQTNTKSYADFGSVEFMQLLMAQLQNQNPLEPMSDSDMMNQISSLNSLDELRSIKMIMSESAVSNQSAYAASLIGKNVTAAFDDGSTLEGLVSGTMVQGGMIYLQIGEQFAPLGNVISIRQE